MPPRQERKRQTSNSARIVQPQSQIIFAIMETSQCGGYSRQPVSGQPILMPPIAIRRGALDRRVDATHLVNKGLLGTM